MAYTDTWNAAFEAVPAAGDNVSDGAEVIRDLKTAIRERVALEHYFDVAGTDADHGKHILNGFQASQYAADAGSSDTYAVTLAPAPDAYFTGMVVNFKANTVNTGAATLNVNSLGAKAIKKNYNVALADGDILAGQIVTVVYDGTNFQLVNIPQALTYTAGVWTPSLRDTDHPAVDTQTYTTQSGYYTKIGRIVHFTANIILSAHDDVSGGLTIAGLNTVGAGSAGVIFPCTIVAGNFVCDGELQAVLASATISLRYVHSTGAVAYPHGSALADDTSIHISGTYFV